MDADAGRRFARHASLRHQLGTSVLDAAFGRLFETFPLDAGFGRRLWASLVEYFAWTSSWSPFFGHLVWMAVVSAILVACFWTSRLEGRLGRHLGRLSLDISFGGPSWTPFWSLGLDTACLRLFRTPICWRWTPFASDCFGHRGASLRPRVPRSCRRKRSIRIGRRSASLTRCNRR